MMRPNSISFYDPNEKPYGDFSPYSQNWFSVEGKQWRSCQQYLLAQRFLGTTQRESIRKAKSYEEAKEIAATWSLRDDWNEVKDLYLQVAIQAIFTDEYSMHPHLRFLLAATGDGKLIYTDPGDADWGIGSEGTGKNKLGHILMKLRQEFQTQLSNPDLLQCHHEAESIRFQVCIHLLYKPIREIGYFRYFSKKPNQYFAIICPDCHEHPKQITASLRWICKECFKSYDGKELGQLGTPQILKRQTDMHFSHQVISFPDLKNTSIYNLQPIEGIAGNSWLAYTSGLKLVRINFDQHQVQTLCDIPKSVVDHREKITLQVSRDGLYTALVNLHGQYGIVINLATGSTTLKLDRGEYFSQCSHFPLAFAELNGRTILIHATDWNRLTISDPATGEELTVRKPPIWERGSPNPPDHYLDYFHGRLVVSPDQEWIADWGWGWHPYGIIRCWSLREWLEENVWESEDAGSTNFGWRDWYWDGPMCWTDSRLLLIWGYGEESMHIIPAVTICDVLNRRELSWFVGPISTNPWYKAHTKQGDHSVPDPTGTFIYDQHLYSFEPQAGMTIWEIETGERIFCDEQFCPNGYNRMSKCFVTSRDSGWFILSRLK